MKSFKDRFNKFLIQENTLYQERSPYGNPSYDSEADAEEFNKGLDPDTDPDEFITRGLKETIDAVQKSFDTKMTGFAEDLSPESLRNMTLGELKKTVDKVFKYVRGISVFQGAKMDAMASSPQAILAGFISSDPAKEAAFNDLNKKLENFSTVIDDVQSEISTLKSKIDEFVEDIVEAGDDDIDLNNLDNIGDENFDEPSMNGRGPSEPTELNF